MAYLFRSLTTNSATTGTTATGNLPSGTADGDALKAIVFVQDQTFTITAVPSGWTLAQTSPESAGVDFQIYVYDKIAASEPASWDWTVSTTGIWRVTVVAFQGVHATLPFHVDAIEDLAATNSIAVGAIVPTVDGCTIFTLAVVEASTASARLWSADGTPTERIEDKAPNAGVSSNGYHTGAYTEEQVTAASITRTLTDDGSVQYMIGYICAIRPAEAAGGPLPPWPQRVFQRGAA
jgi:hypothetical protein